MLATIVGHILAIGIGLSLGLIGGGGSILAVPILIYVLGLSPKTAIAVSLIVVGVVSALGAIPHWRRGHVNLPLALQFIPLAMVGAWGGSQIARLPQVSEGAQLLAFATVMVVASVLMIRKGQRPSAQSAETLAQPQAARRSSSRKVPNPIWQKVLVPLEGLGVGIVTGFVGVGGGFLIIPALVLVGGVAMQEAIGTSLVIIAANSTAGFMGYVHQVTLDWGLIASFTLAASGGTFLGAYLNRFLRAEQLQKGFGYFVLAVAILVLIKQ